MNAFDTSGPSVILSQPGMRNFFPQTRHNIPQNMPQIALPGSNKSPPPGILGPKPVRGACKAAVLSLLEKRSDTATSIAKEVGFKRQRVSVVLQDLKAYGVVERTNSVWSLK